MATITFDSELLRQPLPEKTLTGALDFRAVHDSASNPVIFTIQRDGRLLLLAQGESANGDIKVIDLSKQVAVHASDKVNALAVTQAKNLDIYLTFATGDGESASKLWILPPLSPTFKGWYEKIGANSACRSIGEHNVIISKLLLVSWNKLPRLSENIVLLTIDREARTMGLDILSVQQ